MSDTRVTLTFTMSDGTTQDADFVLHDKQITSFDGSVTISTDPDTGDVDLSVPASGGGSTVIQSADDSIVVTKDPASNTYDLASVKPGALLSSLFARSSVTVENLTTEHVLEWSVDLNTPDYEKFLYVLFRGYIILTCSSSIATAKTDGMSGRFVMSYTDENGAAKAYNICDVDFTQVQPNAGMLIPTVLFPTHTFTTPTGPITIELHLQYAGANLFPLDVSIEWLLRMEAQDMEMATAVVTAVT